jgi:Tfp pilus assembly major pilin PilA
LGQWWGVFYLLFFWLWLPGLIAFIEMIVFLCTDQTKWDDKYNEGRPKAPGEGSGGTIIIAAVAGFFVLIAVIGILAAIALPAYQDYTVRARVSAAEAATIEYQNSVADFYQKNDMFPDSNIMLGLTEPQKLNEFSQIEVTNNGTLTITFTQPAHILGSTLIFRPQIKNHLIASWTCNEGTLKQMHRSSKCRSQR